MILAMTSSGGDRAIRRGCLPTEPQAEDVRSTDAVGIPTDTVARVREATTAYQQAGRRPSDTSSARCIRYDHCDDTRQRDRIYCGVGRCDHHYPVVGARTWPASAGSVESGCPIAGGSALSPFQRSDIWPGRLLSRLSRLSYIAPYELRSARSWW